MQDAAQARPPIWRTRRFWLQIAFLGGMTALIVWRTDLSAAWRVLKGLDPALALAGIAVLVLSNFVHTLKWQRLLLGVGRVQLKELLAVFWAAMATNNIIPLRAGDILRVQVLAGRTGMPRSAIVATLVTERLLDAGCFIVLLAISVPLVGLSGFINVIALVAALAFALLLVVTVLTARVRVVEGLEHRLWYRVLPPPLKRAVQAFLPDFIDGLKPLGSFRSGFEVFGWALAAWTLEAVAYGLFGLAFDLDVQAAGYVVVMVAVNFVSSLTILPANLGVYELTATELLRLLGAAPGEATAYAIGSHLLVIFTVMLGGLLSLWYLRLSLDDVFYLKARTPDAGGAPSASQPAPRSPADSSPALARRPPGESNVR
jgi:uncharacterized protein (TIRG00374 family)